MPTIGAFGRRISPHISDIPADIRFFGSFPDTVENVEQLLRRTIEGKIDKYYSLYPEGSLWLLVYEVSFFSVGPAPSKAAGLARELIQLRRHPFSEIWYIFPYAHENLGAIERVWP